jgi:hypothetical protein
LTQSAKGIASRAKPSYQHCTRSEKRGAIARCYCRACRGPKQADQGGGNKIAYPIDSGQHAEGHAVVSLVNEFCAQRNLQRLLDGNFGRAESRDKSLCSEQNQKRVRKKGRGTVPSDRWLAARLNCLSATYEEKAARTLAGILE